MTRGSRHRGSRIVVRVHPPERRRRGAGVAASMGCCCCCCLHSFGGLIGAAAAGKWRNAEERSATIVYWLSLLALFGISYAWFFRNDDYALFNLFLVLPGIQIAASVVAALIALIIAGPKALLRIWSITWRGLLGTAIGFVVVVGMCNGVPPW
jgi:hypothetical protein